MQRFELGKVVNRLRAIIDDVWCLSASMAKLELIHRHVDENRIALDWLVATEIEYVVSVCRSMFDLLQEVIVHIWESIKLHGNDRANPKLKQSFADIVMHGDTPLSSTEIIARSKIPDFLGDYYSSRAPFFADLRSYRNKFLHHGHVIGNTLNAFNGFAELMLQRIEFPPPVAPGYAVFFRNAHNPALLRALSQDAKWWDRREDIQRRRWSKVRSTREAARRADSDAFHAQLASKSLASRWPLSKPAEALVARSRSYSTGSCALKTITSSSFASSASNLWFARTRL